MKTEDKKLRAFPRAVDMWSEDELGMTLRDFFANSAMQNPVSYKPRNIYQWFRWAFGYSYKACSRPNDENAIQAYELADAMLKQREL